MSAGDDVEVARLTSRFYTVIPHSFGRNRPPPLDTLYKVKAKIEMCDVLSDIETAQVIPSSPVFVLMDLSSGCALLPSQHASAWLIGNVYAAAPLNSCTLPRVASLQWNLFNHKRYSAEWCRAC